MKILQLNIIRGANFWSETDQQLVVLKLQLRDVNDESEVDMVHFIPDATKIFPSISKDLEKFPSDGVAFGAVGFIAKELLAMALVRCDYVRTHAVTDKNEQYVILPYEIPEATEFAAKCAVSIVRKLMDRANYDNVRSDVEILENIKLKYGPGATTSYILAEIQKRGIPFRKFKNSSLILLGYGVYQKKIRAAVTDNTSGLGIEIAGDKEEAKRLLEEEHFPVPKGILVSSEEELKERINEIPYPVVIKPLDGNRGRGITTGINDIRDAVFAFNLARNISEAVIVEEHVNGDDYRFLLVNYKLIAVAKRTPAHVTGDGSSTIKQLIEKENKNPARGNGNEFVLAPIVIDNVTQKILKDKQLALGSVLPAGETLFLKYTANISAGGTSTDVTELVHPENKFIAERIARLFNLDICGIDVITTAINIPLTRKRGAVIEVNAGPGLRMHSDPQKGIPRNVAAPIADMLFPKGKRSKIPMVAVADSKGANVIARLTAYFTRLDKYKTGYNSSDGIYIMGHLTSRGNCTDYRSVQEVLYDPTIDFAVVQCADKSIFESGLPFDSCDISIFSGFSEKHFQSNGNGDIKDEMKIKSVLARSTSLNGCAIINADIELLGEIEKNVRAKVALFSTNEKNEKMKQHLKIKGLGATFEKQKIVIYRDDKVANISDIRNILSLPEEDRELVLQVVLPAILAAVARGISIDTITEGVKTFKFPPLNPWPIALKNK